MQDFSEFQSIGPYQTNEEAVFAFKQLAENPLLTHISRYFYPEEEPDYLKKILLSLQSVDDFQKAVMTKLVEKVIDTTVRNFSYDGIANIDVEKKFLALSNHRDIILDPSITQTVLSKNGIPMTEIAVGDNLIQNKFIEYLVRSNRMIKVIRGVKARELYLSSQLLSKYIRQSIVSGKSSIWLAQRQGRTKNGYDTTEQGLLKMLDMSGDNENFKKNFEELNIIPMSISYQIEPCDILKARELLISQTQKYVKAEGEDLVSILTGVQQMKGNVHLNIGKPLTTEEVSLASLCDKNDRYQYIRHAINIRVVDGYKLWNNNYIAYDLLNETTRFADMYTAEEKEWFIEHMTKQMETVEPELDRVGLRKIFLEIYSNPIVTKDIRAKGGLFLL